MKLNKIKLLSLILTFLLIFINLNTNIVVAQEKTNNEVTSVNLISVGDNLIHSRVIESGKKKDGTYNYDFLYKNIKDELSWADIKVINQETMLVKDKNRYSGYPTFGSPYAIGEAVIDAGFNVVLHATNHTYDKGLSGINETLDFWDNYKDITVVGLHPSKKDYNKIDIIEKNNIKIALLNYTYSLNGFKLPKDKQYLVDTLYDTDKIISDIKKANKQADFVIVFPHWGIEYSLKENSSQEKLAKTMAEAGADLIIGTHPHVVEPLKEIKTKDGRIVPVYYSLGNFVSNQEKIETMLGAMAKITIVKDKDKTYIEKYEMIPLVTHIESYSKSFTIYTLKDYTESLAKEHRLRRVKGKSFSKENIEKIYKSIK